MKTMKTAILAAGLAVAGGAFAEDAYVEATGEQAVLLDYYATPRTRVLVDFAYMDATTLQQRILGSTTDLKSGLSFGSYINGGGCFAFSAQEHVGCWWGTEIPVVANSRTVLSIDSAGTAGSDGGNGTPRTVCVTEAAPRVYQAAFGNLRRNRAAILPMTIFADNDSSSPTGTSFPNKSKSKLYSFKVYESDQLVRDLRPYSGDGKVGLRDELSGKVYVSATATPLVYHAATGDEARPKLTIMPMGDSITYGAGTPGGYRLPLLQLLQAAGYNATFVGNNVENPTNALIPHVAHEGHSGWKISKNGNGILQHIQLWLASAKYPDALLLHIGTNDSGESTFEARAIDDLDRLVTKIAELSPGTHVFVTTLLPRSAEPNNTKIETSFNPQVQPLVERHRAAGHKVHFLDMHAKLDLATDFYDGLHPNAGGYGKMAAAWFESITNVFTTADAGTAAREAPARPEPPVWGHENNVPESEYGQYRLVYAKDALPLWGEPGSMYGMSWDVNRSGEAFPFDRVAYYVELQKADGTAQWVWASMDAFTDDLKKIAIPDATSRACFDTETANLSVWSNVPGVENAAGHVADIEFWPSNYSVRVSGTVLGLNDKPDPGDYGCMQIHDKTTETCLFAFNHWGQATFAPSLGIGNCPQAGEMTLDGGSCGMDWTFSNNAGEYTVRRLKIFARPAVDRVAPVAETAKVASYGTQVFVTFSKKIDPASVAASAFAGDAFTVTDAWLLEDGKTVALKTTKTNPQGGASITVRGVRDLAQNAVAETTLVTKPYGIPTEILLKVGASYDLSGWELVYACDIPVKGAFRKGLRPYWYDQSENAAPVDRVAYFFALDARRGNGDQYAFTAFDAPSDNRAVLAVPTPERGVAFQQPVRNAFVKSSNANVNLGSIPDGCNIEFWSCDYSQANAKGVPGGNAEGNFYDAGDQMSNMPTSGGYGSMQVHVNTHKDLTVPRTVWALNNFGNDGNVLCTGIGPCNRRLEAKAHDDSTDWTFAVNADEYAGRRLYVLVRPKDRAAKAVEEVAEAVGAETLAGWRLAAASVGLPRSLRMNDAAWAATNFYHVDNRAHLGSFDRVAYFVRCRESAGAEAKWVWTAMDAFTTDPMRIGVPSGGYYFQQRVNNLDVKSNVPGIVTGTGLATGNIEFAPSNYSGNLSNFSWLQGTGTTKHDWNDSGFGTSTGHGCMQVCNYGAEQVLWALNNFNNGTADGAFGIGNRPTDHPDWTFANNLKNLPEASLYIFVHETTPGTEPPAPAPVYADAAENLVRGEAAADLGSDVDLDDWELVFAVTNVPTSCRLNEKMAGAGQFYTLDRRYAVDEGSFDRVAYYVEAQYKDSVYPDDAARRWVWVAMDPFTQKAHQLGVPYGGYMFQKQVTNMDVRSNDPHITSVTGVDTGCVEIWPGNYGKGLSSNPWGGAGDAFDWNDSGASTNWNGHGSFQVHNYGAGEVLFSLVHFNGGSKPGFGVGANQHITKDKDLDYTFTENADKYAISRICCFVRRTPSPARVVTAPKAKRAVPAVGNRQLALVFDADLADGVAGDAALTISGAKVFSVSRATARVLVAETSALAPGATYTLAYSGVRGVTGAAQDGAVTFTVLPASETVAPACLAGVAEAAQYRLAYRFDLPEFRAGCWSDTPYSVDEEFFFHGPFDRIAYCLETTTTEGEAKWVWASMDAFTDNIVHAAMPTSDRGKVFQQKVANLTVRASANAGVTAGDNLATGNIEFWPSNYGEGVKLGDIGGDPKAFDFDDSGAGTGAGYGSMQVHNWGAKQTVFAINSFGSNSSTERLAIGIGNNPSGSPDWTHKLNSNTYSKRRLWIFVRETAVASTGEGPEILVQPQDVACKQDEAFVLSVTAVGATSYQWYRNGAPVPGATDANYVVQGATGLHAGTYTVLARGPKGATLSTPAQVTVRGNSTVILLR